MNKVGFVVIKDGREYTGDISEPDALLTAYEYALSNNLSAKLFSFLELEIDNKYYILEASGTCWDETGLMEWETDNLVDAVYAIWKGSM